MLMQIKYLASWTSVKFSKRLGQRGAEMVEYAIVLACIVVLASWYYGTRDKNQSNAATDITLYKLIRRLWDSIANTANSGIK